MQVLSHKVVSNTCWTKNGDVVKYAAANSSSFQLAAGRNNTEDEELPGETTARCESDLDRVQGVSGN